MYNKLLYHKVGGRRNSFIGEVVEGGRRTRSWMWEGRKEHMVGGAQSENVKSTTTWGKKYTLMKKVCESAGECYRVANSLYMRQYPGSEKAIANQMLYKKYDNLSSFVDLQR